MPSSFAVVEASKTPEAGACRTGCLGTRWIGGGICNIGKGLRVASKKTLARLRYFERVKIMAASQSTLQEQSDLNRIAAVLSGHAGSTADEVIDVVGRFRLPTTLLCVRLFDEGQTEMFEHIVSTDGRGLDVAHIVDGVCTHLHDEDRLWLSTRALPVTDPGILDLEIVSGVDVCGATA